LVKKSAHNKNKYMNIGEKKGVSLWFFGQFHPTK
jgi:hypothetical protein